MAKMILRSYAEENARRRRFRTIYLLIGLPVLAIILLYGVKAGTMFVWAQTNIDSYTEGDLAESVDKGDQLKVGNIIQPWIAYYNSGTAKVADKQYVEGITDLKGALEIANGTLPGACMIRANLAMAYEQYGDTFKLQGSPQQALGFYNLGKQAIDNADPSCFPPPPPSTSEDEQEGEPQDGEPQEGEGSEGDSAGEKMNETKERLEEKSKEAGEEGDPQDGEGSEGDETEQSKEEKIREQTEQTNKDRAEKENQQRGEKSSDNKMGEDEPSDESPSVEVEKPW